jgi:hypothetical protein
MCCYIISYVGAWSRPFSQVVNMKEPHNRAWSHRPINMWWLGFQRAHLPLVIFVELKIIFHNTSRRHIRRSLLAFYNGRLGLGILNQIGYKLRGRWKARLVRIWSLYPLWVLAVHAKFDFMGRAISGPLQALFILLMGLFLDQNRVC